jgi:CheY-like chemotaxis protein
VKVPASRRNHPRTPQAFEANFVARKDSKPLLILHVEDDENDALLFGKACERAGLPACVYRVEAADVAKAYLLGEGIYSDRSLYPLPQIVLLDLKMPRMDGFQFLKWLRQTDTFARLPVLIFTASMSREDKSRAIADGANSYFVKPASFEALVKMVEGISMPNEPRWN